MSLQRRTPLRSMSKRKDAEIRERAKWKLTVCELASDQCRGPIDRHEIVRRTQDRTAALDRRRIIGLCRFHHELDRDQDIAVELGIRVRAWMWRMCEGDPDREEALIAEAEGRRRFARESGLV